MKCSQCQKNYDLQTFNSFRIYDDDDYLVKKYDLCNDCIDQLEKNDKLNEFMDKAIKKGYKAYEISRCSTYDDCAKINNLRIMCEKKEELGEPAESSDPFFIKSFVKPVTWCDPADAGIIRASVRLNELFDNYDKNSTELSNNMLNYTKNMHHLTWVLLAFAIVGFILTFINAYIAYLQLIK